MFTCNCIDNIMLIRTIPRITVNHLHNFNSKFIGYIIQHRSGFVIMVLFVFSQTNFNTTFLYCCNMFEKFLLHIIHIVFVKRKCEQKGPKKVSTFSTRFHVVSNVFPKYQMLTF